MFSLNLNFLHKIPFQVLMVTGGHTTSVSLDTTETLATDASSWVLSTAKLPRPMQGLRAANIDDRVLIFGKLYFTHHTPDITGT